MSASELLEAAKEALKKNRHGDAYRLAGKSNKKKSSESAWAVRVEAACGMKNKNAAKSAFDRVDTGKVKRDLRSKCRENDIRLGL